MQVSLAHQPDTEEAAATHWTAAIAAAVSGGELEAAVGPLHENGVQVSVTDVRPGQGPVLPAGQARPSLPDPAKGTKPPCTQSEVPPCLLRHLPEPMLLSSGVWAVGYHQLAAGRAAWEQWGIQVPAACCSTARSLIWYMLA